MNYRDGLKRKRDAEIAACKDALPCWLLSVEYREQCVGAVENSRYSGYVDRGRAMANGVEYIDSHCAESDEFEAEFERFGSADCGDFCVSVERIGE